MRGVRRGPCAWPPFPIPSKLQHMLLLPAAACLLLLLLQYASGNASSTSSGPFEDELVNNLVQMAGASCEHEVECAAKGAESYTSNQFFAAIPYFAQALQHTEATGSCQHHINLAVSFLQQRHVRGKHELPVATTLAIVN